MQRTKQIKEPKPRLHALAMVRKYFEGTSINVTSVVDALGFAKATVSKRDCKIGVAGSPTQCALAKAFNREYDGAIIGVTTCYLVKGNVATRYATPALIRTEIRAFDRNPSGSEFMVGTMCEMGPHTKSQLLGKRKSPQPKNKSKKPIKERTKSYIPGLRMLVAA